MAATFMVDENSLKVIPVDEAHTPKAEFSEGETVLLFCECWANIHITAPTPTIGFWDMNFIAHRSGGGLPDKVYPAVRCRNDYSGWDTHERFEAYVNIGTLNKGTFQGYVEVKGYHM